MATCRKLFVASLAVCCLFASAAAQLNTTTPEVAQRSQFPPAALSFNFATTNTGATNNAAGSIVNMNLGNDAVLGTLPKDGVSQNRAVYNACTINVPHVHPRGTEIYYVTSGALTVGIAEETTTGRIIGFNITQGQNAVIPQGLLHYVQNTACDQTTLLQFFDSSDAGLVFAYDNLLKFPDTAITAFTGLSSASLGALRAANPGTGSIFQDADCLRRCGLPAGSPGASGPSGVTAPRAPASAPTSAPVSG